MPRGTILSDIEVGQVLAYFEQGLSKRAIGRKLNRSEAAVRNVIEKGQNYGKNKTGGPKSKLSARQKRQIVKKASNSRRTARQIASECDVQVSKWTIHRVLRRSNFIKNRKLLSAPCLLPRHKVARLEFAKANTATDFSKVIFSDEKKFNLDGTDGFDRYWRDLRKDPLIFSKRNFGGGSLMVWGGFCADGMLELAFPSTKMNSKEYVEVLRMNLLPFINIRGADYWTFQHDNATIHVSKATSTWLQDHNVDVMSWPACSPDLNPIENVWGILAREVYKENKQYNNIKELKQGVITALENFNKETVKTLIKSMRTRIYEVIKNKGGLTHY